MNIFKEIDTLFETPLIKCLPALARNLLRSKVIGIRLNMPELEWSHVVGEATDFVLLHFDILCANHTESTRGIFESWVIMLPEQRAARTPEAVANIEAIRGRMLPRIQAANNASAVGL